MAEIPGDAASLSIFELLDTSGDGYLTQEEVLAASRRLGLPSSPTSVAAFLHCADLDGDGRVDFGEFTAYRQSREAKVRAVYDQLRGESHVISSTSLASGLDRLQMPATDDAIHAYMQALDKDGSGTVSFDEFRNWLLLLPVDNPRAVFESHAREALFDDAQGSPHLAVKTVSNGLGWAAVGTKLFSGAVAGVASRTATAPMDRLKLLLQAAPAGAPKLSLSQVCRQVASESGGIAAFWRGNSVNCLKIAPETATKFLAFDLVSSAIAADATDITAIERFVPFPRGTSHCIEEF